MNRERFEQVNRLFIEAQHFADEERQAFLDTACAGDPELRREIEALIEADREADVALATAHVHGQVSRAAAESVGLPEAVGQYRIIRLIGEGGMGSVYEAEQDDPRRRVALKVIRPGMMSRKLLGRFRHEAQVLGQLRHPGIAQIYEAGTEDRGQGGQPYFAMELVAGQPLPEYATSQNLGTRDRLELVARVCDALHHAHQKGVIHRDLKPGNILVEADGQPKILDFGVARATDADIQTVTLATDIGELVGTIPYMSPEQASGDPDALDIRSDIYAMGVISFELLGGRLPYQVAGKMIHEAVRVIREDEPSRLSSIDRTLRGDVETIVAKALEKDKDRRYQSAAELAADIRRYLDDEPIVAMPASTFYQMRKFAKRNRPIVASAAVVFAVLAVATVVSTTLAVRESRVRRAEQEQRALAESARDEAEAVSAFLRNMIGAANPWSVEAGSAIAREIKVVDVLDNAATELDTSFEDQPEVEAAVREALGNTYVGIGQLDEAERHLERAVDMRLAKLGDEHAKTLGSRRALAALYMAQGRLEEAQTLCRQVVETRRRVAPDDPALIGDLAFLGNILRDLGSYDEAESMLREALELCRMQPDDQDDQQGSILNELALTVHYKGDYDGAEPLFQEALATHRRLHGAEHPAVAIDLHNLASLRHDQGDSAAAESMYREALDMRMKILGEEHPETLTTMNNLGLLYDNESRFDEAEPLYVRALEIRTRVLGENNLHTISSMYNLGVFYRNTEQFEKAEPILVKVMDGFLDLLGEEHLYTIISMNGLAILYDTQGRLDEAEPLYDRTLGLRRKVFGDEHPNTLRAAANRAGLYMKRGRYDEAETLYALAVAGARKSLPEGHANTAKYLRGHGRALLKVTRYDEAETTLIEAHDLSEKAHGPADNRTVEAIESLIELYETRGDGEAAAAWRSKISPP